MSITPFSIDLLAVLYVVLIAIIDFIIFPISFFLELRFIIIYFILYLVGNYFVLFTIASFSFTKRKSRKLLVYFLLY